MVTTAEPTTIPDIAQGSLLLEREDLWPLVLTPAIYCCFYGIIYT